MNRFCENCGECLSDGANFCPVCGKPVKRQSNRYCKNCGAIIVNGAKYCSACSAPVNELADVKTPEKCEPDNNPTESVEFNNNSAESAEATINPAAADDQADCLPESEGESRHCKYCGAVIEGGTQFCPVCNTPTDD